MMELKIVKRLLGFWVEDRVEGGEKKSRETIRRPLQLRRGHGAGPWSGAAQQRWREGAEVCESIF